MAARSELPILVADIGGTNARFALATADERRRPVLEQILELRGADYATLGDAARHYLQTSGATVEEAVFAVASPVTGDQIKITNNPWSFSVQALRAELRLHALWLINDFAAIGYAISHLGPEDVRPIGAMPERLARDRTDGHYSVLGPGTGLGVGRVLLRHGEAIILETEGGHVGFAPGNTYELKVLERLLRQYSRVSAERLLCGPGLLNLYRAVGEIEGLRCDAETPAQVSEQANAQPDGLAGRTVALFCELLGCFAGDTVLTHGAWDGVYLAGGITLKLLPWLERGGLRRRFEQKGRFEALLSGIPTLAITHPHVGLLGSAACAFGMHERRAALHG
ncbi:glucokinase [Solimonas soli]|uniref:glucokinase n=1 Tax=Solimonas soli TaxID=413479 RepID=UPI000489C421|nr:glucokinase [Solimonas soli]